MDGFHRRSIRLSGYDYSSDGAYFITICAAAKQCLFGDVIDGESRLNSFGEIVAEEWLRTEAIRSEVKLDSFVVMPNHFHAIVIFDVPQGRVISNERSEVVARAPRSLGALVAGFKSAATRRINLVRDTPDEPVWQRNYYEHIIRNESELNTIRGYIVTNPTRWDEDTENPSYKKSTK